MSLKEFLIKNKEVVQLGYGIFLIVLIPFLIAINTIYIINVYNDSIDAGLQRQALSFGRSIYSQVQDELGDKKALLARIENIVRRNSDVRELNVLKPKGAGFTIFASSDETKLDLEEDFYYYNLAWVQPDNDGLATDSLTLGKNKNDQNAEDIAKTKEAEERFWLVAMPVIGVSGEKEALLSVKLSSKIIDDLTRANRNRSIYILVITVLVSFLFLMINVRLWDYALLYKKIKEVDQMKDEFVSMASHELRTPVTGIKGFASMILDGSYGEVGVKAKNAVKKIGDSAERLAVLVNDLLDVSRIEQGRLAMDNQPMDPSPVIIKTVDEMRPQAGEKNLSLAYNPHKEKLPLIRADKDRFIQVLVNILGNAVKYTEKGSVEIFTSEERGGKELVFKIKDTGIGISPTEKEKLFQKFYRVQNEKTKDISGTGLGLWITKEIVERMGGKISLDSIEGTGTQVVLSFPVEK